MKCLLFHIPCSTLFFSFSFIVFIYLFILSRIDHNSFFIIFIYRILPLSNYLAFLVLRMATLVSSTTNAWIPYKDSSGADSARKLNSCRSERWDGRIANKLRSISIIERAKVGDRARWGYDRKEKIEKEREKDVKRSSPVSFEKFRKSLESQ